MSKKDMTPEEHEYFHVLMWHLTRQSEPKFSKGCPEHRDKGNLWDMSDDDLESNMREEITDYMMYYAEKLRREYVKAGKSDVPPDSMGLGLRHL